MFKIFLKSALNSSLKIARYETAISNGISQIRLQTVLCFQSSANKSTLIPDETLGNHSFKDIETQALTIYNRNTNPFCYFISKFYKDFKQQNPNSTQVEIFRDAGSKWRSMNFEDKKIYLDEAQKNREKNKEDLEKLFSNLPESEKDALQKRLTDYRTYRRIKLKEFRIKREKNLLNRPKRAVSPFILFSQSLDRGEAPIHDFLKGASLKWKALAQQDKEKFEEEFKEMNEKYKKDLHEWETKMLREGRKDLLRKKFINEIKGLVNKEQIRMKKLNKSKESKREQKVLKAVNVLMKKRNARKKALLAKKKLELMKKFKKNKMKKIDSEVKMTKALAKPKTNKDTEVIIEKVEN